MKKLMMTTAVVALTGTGVMAQDLFRGEADPAEIYASDFIGMRVYSSEAAIETDAYEGVQGDWQDIGEVNDVILSRDGNVEAVLVDIGGFLGMGERQVAVDMDAIRFVSDSATADNENDYFLVMNATRANFEEAPEYMRGDMPGETATGAADTSGTTGMQPPAAGQTAPDGTTQPPGDSATAADGAAQPPADGATAADGTATTTPSVGPAPADSAAARESFVREGYEPLGDLTTETLTGAAVYDANDEWIGEVGELIVTEQGQVTDAVIDVGGFLGIGEKPVSLPLDQVNILRQTDGSEVRIYVSMTKEELEALPTYEN